MSDGTASAGGEQQQQQPQETTKPSKVEQTASELQGRSNTTTQRLYTIVSRIERLESEKEALNGDIKDIYAEAKSVGFDTKVLRMLIRLRKMEPAEVEEMETLLDVYRTALGM